MKRSCIARTSLPPRRLLVLKNSERPPRYLSYLESPKRSLSTQPTGQKSVQHNSPVTFRKIGTSSSASEVEPRKKHERREKTEQIQPNAPPSPTDAETSKAPYTFTFTNSPVLDAIVTTALGLAAVFVGGIVYVEWYKYNVLNKMEEAFAAGNDPALELARSSYTRRQSPSDDPSEDIPTSVPRKEQEMIDSIVWGEELGHYYMLLGPKGAGKGGMIFKSMAEVDAEGVSICDAHPDLEIFRLRLGKALNYDFNEDTQTALFQRRDPREGGAPLDIERALNKLEKVAIRCSKRRGKPLVLVINNVHFFQNNEEGKKILLQLQQKAEAWAVSGILTMIFTSDDFWPFNVLRKTASRMSVISVSDLNPADSLQACKQIRNVTNNSPSPPDVMQEAISIVGGRLSYLGQISRAKDPVSMAKHLLRVEKGWLLSRIGLIPDCDDDVMDEQKWSSCSWLLLQAFVKLREEQEAAHIAAGGSADDDLPLPKMSWYKARQIMTRADFMEELDRLNVISIDVQHNIRPDSYLILHAAREVTSEDGFDELLESVRDRIDEIESLQRTRELTFKDMGKGDVVRLAVDKRGGELLELRDTDN